MFLLKKVFELREKAHVDHEKPFLEHLEDLRIVITRIVITLVISMIFCFIFQKHLMLILRAPAEKVVMTKQAETMPNAKKYPGIKVPTVDQWEKAKEAEQIVGGLTEAQQESFFAELGDPELKFHVRSVTLLKAVNALPKKKREDFIGKLDLDEPMRLQLQALLKSGPDTNANAGSNIRMMSALKPTETFMLSMKLAFFAGIILSFPLLLFFTLQFVLPGLHKKERKVLWPAMGVGFGLFLSGVLFAYFFVLPSALKFFYEWSGDLGVSNDWRIGEYITFATQFTLLFGLSFELPVVVMVLVKLGLLSYETMARTRSYAIVAIYIAAAVITPTPDIMTLNLMALPMLFLYEICIWLAWFDRKKEREAEQKEKEESERRRREWLLSNKDREVAAGTEDEDDDEPEDPFPDATGSDKDDSDDVDSEDIEESGDDGWYEGYGSGDEHHNFEDHSDLEDIESAEEWIEPDDAITGDPFDESAENVQSDAEEDIDQDDQEKPKE